MSSILTLEVAQQAVNAVLPSIQSLVRTNVLKRESLHIVIGEPAFTDRRDPSFERWQSGGILLQHSIGDPSQWQRPYDEFARRKCYQSWRWEMTMRQMLSEYRYLLQPGDAVYEGSAISRNLVVGVSGVQQHFDHMIAHWILEACRAFCIDGTQDLAKIFPSGFVQ